MQTGTEAFHIKIAGTQRHIGPFGLLSYQPITVHSF